MLFVILFALEGLYARLFDSNFRMEYYFQHFWLGT